MKRLLGKAGSFAAEVAERMKLRKGMFSVVALVFVLQLYFVRELAAAELLFGVVFAVLFVLGGLAYLLGTLGERGLDLAESGIRIVAESARRGYASLEEVNRKPFRHPRSESAQ